MYNFVLSSRLKSDIDNPIFFKKISHILVVKSSPPSIVSPLIEITSIISSNVSSNVTSNVPPPKSSTINFRFLSKIWLPSDNAAAVGSFISLSTVSPASSAAILVSFLCLSLKYAGTLIIALSIFSLSCFSALSFKCFSTNEESICASKVLFFTLIFASVPILLLKLLAVSPAFIILLSFASSPTIIPSFSSIPTTDGIKIFPYSFFTNCISPLSSIYVAKLFVVPKSIPIILPIVILLL